MNGAAWGGSEELWFRTAIYAAGKNHKVACAFYYWNEKEEKIEALKKAGCQVYLLPNKGRTKKNLLEKINYKICKWKLKQTISALPFKEYDLTVVNLGGLEIYTSAWKKAYHKLSEYALLFHNYSEEEFYKPAKAERMRGWIQHAADNFFAAKRIKEVLEKKLDIIISDAGFFINPITIIPPSVPAPYPKEPITFAMLAELDVNRKAQDNLITALSLPKWMTRSWQLQLYGKGRDSKLLQQLIATNGMSERIKLRGHVADVKTVLENAHLILQITHRDAMPLAVMEAMAVGRPVVVSRVGDMPYWVEEGRNGWVANNASVKEIDAVMERAWQQKEYWQQAGEQSFFLFKEKFPASPEQKFLQQLHQTLIKE